jgi:hypothetical protein
MSRFRPALSALVAAITLVPAACAPFHGSKAAAGDVAVASMPAPDGYSDAGIARNEVEGCGSPVGCGKATITRHFRPTSPSSRQAGCDALRSTLPAWVQAGFASAEWSESATDGLVCNVAGSIRGAAVSAEVEPDGEIGLNAAAP